MAVVEFWIGKSARAKTGTAIELLNHEITRNGIFSARYIVPTVGTKLELEKRYFETANRTLLNDPINIFFKLTQEVASREIKHKHLLNDTMRRLFLKKVINDTELDFFKESSKSNGFIDELGYIIDELKVQMVESHEIMLASEKIDEKGHRTYAKKLKELAMLYENYQNTLIHNGFYDREGLMWIAAETIKKDKSVLKDLNTVIFDGFSRFTPIQTHFIKILARNIGKVILIFDYDNGGGSKYMPEADTMEALEEYFVRKLEIPVKKRSFGNEESKNGNLTFLKDNIFESSPKKSTEDDTTVKIIESPYPLAEAEEVAVTIKKMLREKRYELNDIACVARNASDLHYTYYYTFLKHGIPLQMPKTQLISTGSGKIIHDFISLKLMGFRAEYFFKLLKSAAFSFQYNEICKIEEKMKQAKKARSNSDFLEKFISDKDIEKIENEDIKKAAFDIFNAVNDITESNYQSEIVNFMKKHIIDKTTNLIDIKVCDTITDRLKEVKLSDQKIGLGNLEDRLNMLCEICAKETVCIEKGNRHIPFLSAQSVGGQKFKVLFLVNLQHGAFPSFTSESPILMDYERDEHLKNKTDLSITMRKEQEKDEMSQFFHTLNSATEKIYLSYHRYDIDGEPLEISDYIHEIAHILPATYANRKRTTFEEMARDFEYSTSVENFVERTVLNFGKNITKEIDALKEEFPEYFQIFNDTINTKADTAENIADDIYYEYYQTKPYSPTELECYIFCRYKWFLSKALRATPTAYDFATKERGTVAHAILNKTYRHFQELSANLYVNLSDFELETVLSYANDAVPDEISKFLSSSGDEEYFYNIALEELRGQIKRFLTREYENSKNARMFPKEFETDFNKMSIGDVKIAGKIDRIDVLNDNDKVMAITDYKLNKTPSATDFKKMEKLQGLFYILALQKKYSDSEILGCSFLSINKTDISFFKDSASECYNTINEKSTNKFSDEEWRALLEGCKEKLAELHRDIAEGKIQKTGKEKKECRNCEYLNLCKEN